MKKSLGFFKTGELFMFNGRVYRVGHLISNTNGYVACVDVITHKTTRLYIDVTVETLEGDADMRGEEE